MGYTCTIVLGDSSHLRVNPSDRSADYGLSGEEGERLRQLFLPNQGSEFHYYSGDGKLEIHGVAGGSSGEFRLNYRG